MSFGRLRAAALLAVCIAAGCARPPVSDTAPAPRFYFGSTVGSEAQFNPATEILNEGFDVLRSNSQDRHVFDRNYAIGARNVWHSVAHADATFRFYGYGRAVRSEWLPLTTSGNTGGGAWVPNYEYHLLGGGMISVRMAEWFEQHHVPHPELLSFATLMTSHYLNEIIENGSSTIPNEDATTDLLLFDLGGIALWRLDAVQRLFSGPLQLTNWPGQPSIDLPSGTLENARQQFILRAPLPWTRDWKLFYDFGLSTLLGASRQLANGDAWSAGVGVDAIDNPIVDPRSGAKGATLRFKGGIFYDRRGSLLWSALAGSRSDVAVVDLNVYPGVLRVGAVSPGVWLQLPRNGGVRLGVTTSWGLGVGHGPER
ncbi:MAG: hypothetical protein JWM41_192 [Gemmatimonadetes bacterium]|nr:hypothetical protein [Gemmatimonadota bacterium]